MGKDILPSHEFFIYVPSMRDAALSANMIDAEKKVPHISYVKRESNIHGLPADVQSWTRIELADTISVYAWLQEDGVRVRS
jgi:hypothetical protein